ncbi:MAG: HAD-IIA family hydrolase [Solirubrobacteraceae bacterium]
MILDLDGCVWVGGLATPRAPDALASLREAGKRLVFLTNDGRHSPEEYVRKLWSIGCRASLEEVVTVGSAIQSALAQTRPGGAFVIGSRAVFRHVAEAGYRIVNQTPEAEQADVVVVVGHDEFAYAELRTAVRAVLGGARMLSGSRDATFPDAGGLSPGTGAIIAALEYATNGTARAVGKPDPQIFGTALERLGSGRTLVIGDRLDSDLAGAAAAGLDGAIVLSGVTSREQAERAADPAPVAIAPDLGTLVLSA